MRILLVESHASSRAGLERLLREHGMSIRSTLGLDEALSELSSSRFDVIIVGIGGTLRAKLLALAERPATRTIWASTTPWTDADLPGIVIEKPIVLEILLQHLFER